MSEQPNDWKQTGKKVSNWGRWGANDEKGTLNLIAPKHIRQAATLIQAGKVYSLSVPLEADGPQWPSRHDTWVTTKVSPRGEGKGVSDDIITMHSHSGTHIDSLCHVWYDHQLYNGYEAAEHLTPDGSTRNAIHNVPAIVGRGVLLDVAGWKGVASLQLGEPISATDLDHCAASQNVTIQSGDIVLVNTGWINTFDADREQFYAGEPGLDMSTPEWLRAHNISAIGADNHAVEVIETMPPDNLPFHQVAIRDMGLYLLEYLDLRQLAAAKAYEFFFVAAPLQLTNAVGSPINPLAIV
ncbi:MAG: cyclase family protein [Chloroflexota bacterium]